MNIAQIKERCTRFVELKSATARNRGDYESIQDGLNQLSSELPVDIEYLLSIIKQAEKALEQIYECGSIKKAEIIAKQALKAIQGDET